MNKQLEARLKKAQRRAEDNDRIGGPRQCVVNCRESGLRCLNPPIHGSSVCLSHGGRLPSVRRAAAIRLAALVDPAIKVYENALKVAAKSPGKLPSNVTVKIVQDLLDRNGFKAPDELIVSQGLDYSRCTPEELDLLEQLAVRLTEPAVIELGSNSEREGQEGMSPQYSLPE